MAFAPVARAAPSAAVVAQAKAEVRPAGDQFEQEADRVADRVVSAPRGAPPLPIMHRLAGGNVAARAADSPGAAGVGMKTGGGFSQSLHRARSHGGDALSSNVRSFVEPRFGEDFSGVRLHRGRQGSDLARSISAKAFTSGSDVFFKQGEYRPETRGGMRLIAHELTHVVQQRGKAAGIQRQGEGEQEASLDTAVGSELKPEGEDQTRSPELERVAAGKKFVRLGSRGDDVRNVQEALVGFGLRQDPPRDLLPKFGVDGIFGSETQRAVIEFQKANGLEADGIVGPDTIRALSASTIDQLIVDDDATGSVPAKAMKKQEFVDAVAAESCAAADTILAPAGLQSSECPGAALFASFISDKPAAEILRLIAKAKPAEVFGAASARQLIDIVVAQVRSAVAIFVETGEVKGIPDNIGIGKDFIEAALAGNDEAVRRKGRSSAAAPAGHAVSPKLRVGGRPLEGGVRARLEGAFGTSLAHVRVHTEPKAATEVSRLDARAVSIGRDVAFAPGEYRPGTLVGDALLAHEVAHTLQQPRGLRAKLDQPLGTSDSPGLEADADTAAVSAVARMWHGSTAWLSQFAGQAMPRLKTGLGLRRCASAPRPGPVPPTPQPQPPTPKPAKPFAEGCPTRTELGPTKAFNHADLENGFAKGQTINTLLGLNTRMELFPRADYTGNRVLETVKLASNGCPATVTDTLNSCNVKGKLLTPVGTGGSGRAPGTRIDCDKNSFIDLHQTAAPQSILEGTGVNACTVVCHQKYFCEKDSAKTQPIGEFLITRNFKAGTFMDTKDNTTRHITTGNVTKVPK